MQTQGKFQSQYGLEHHVIQNINALRWNLSTPRLYEEAIRRREGRLAHLGPLVVHTVQHKVNVRLVNIGWSGGPYGVGQWVKIAYTWAIVHAAFSGSLVDVLTVPDPIFGMAVPITCPDVPAKVLNPRQTWVGPAAYNTQARRLAGMFVENFKAFADQVPDGVCAAGPQVG